MEQFDPFVSVTGEQASLFENFDPGARLARKKSRSKSRGPIVTGKNFILDTNVLLHDPNCIQRFDDNHVWIPVDVLAELDKFKNEQSERGANARAVHRSLSKIFSLNGASVTEGVPTAGGGTLRLAVFDFGGKHKSSSALASFLRIFPDTERVDHRILATVLLVQEKDPAPAILVTKDLNMQLKGLAVGLQCEDYLNDKVEAKDVDSYDPQLIDIDPYEMQRFASSGELQIDAARIAHLSLNEYVLLRAGERKTMPARLSHNGLFKRLQIPESLHIPRGIDLRPANLGQQCLIDALLDPSISLVTCYGQAGTGKTLLAVAAGLHSVFSKNFNGITISRPVVAMGDTLGFLPGSLEEKMRPWLQPIYDALEVLMPPPGLGGGHHAPPPQVKKTKKNYGAEPPQSQQQHGTSPRKPYEHLIEQGIVEIEALCYIRGRSIPRRFFVLDEAQQLTPLEAKTIVTRMSKGSKLIMVGDPAQIDNPYVDSRSNGLVYTRNRLKGHSIAAHVSLNKGERSPLAEIGAKLM
ncbi:MAG: PhoH family protein [Verrucomicrobiota bacterium]